MKRVATLVNVTLMMALVTTGCRGMTARPLGQNLDDAAIQAEVKTRLAEEQLRNLSAVTVQSDRGVVVLTGRVASADDKANAGDIAANVPGVARVVNDLVISDPAGNRTRASAPPPSLP